MIVLDGFIVPYTAKHTINLPGSSSKFIFIVGGIAGFIAPVFRLVAAWPYIFRPLTPAKNIRTIQIGLVVIKRFGLLILFSLFSILTNGAVFAII